MLGNQMSMLLNEKEAPKLRASWVVRESLRLAAMQRRHQECVFSGVNFTPN